MELKTEDGKETEQGEKKADVQAEKNVTEEKTGQQPKTKKKGFFKRHRKLIVFLLIIAILAGVVWKVIIPKYFSKSDQTAVSTQTFETIQKMDISNTIAVTGTIAAKESRSVSTLVSDTKVLTVSVSVGDYVNAGDPICTFDTTSIQDKIDALEKKMDIADAKADLSLAEANTTLAQDLQDNTTTVSRNQGSYDDALADYYNACDGYNSAKEALRSAEADYNTWKGQYDNLSDDIKSGSTSVSVSSNEYKIKNNYSYYKGLYETAQQTVSSYETSIETAKDALDKAQETLGDSATSTQRTYTKDNVSVYSSELDSSTTNDDNQTQLEEYEEELADCTVVAPISGLITSVSVEVGDEYTEKSEICVIQDDTGYIVEGTVDQYDISSISENMTAVVKTDATGDDELAGVVTFVSPVPESSSTSTTTSGTSGTSSSSSSTDYPIEITLTDRDDRLRIGMTAETSVVTEQAKDVLAVPYDCVQTDSDGNSVIYVADTTASGNTASMPSGAGKASMSSDMPTAGEAASEMPTDMQGGPSGGKGGMSGNAAGGAQPSQASGTSDKSEGSTSNTVATRAIVVTTGLETDYYTEVQSDEIYEGMQVLVPNSISTSTQSTSDTSSASLFGIGGGGGQQGGGAPSGGGGNGGGPGGGGF